MNTKSIIYLILLFFTFTSCENNRNISELPIVIEENGYVYIPMIFEKDTLLFLFDTGASYVSVLDYQNKRGLIERLTYFVPLDPLEPSITTSIYDDGNFRLGDFTIRGDFLVWSNLKKINVLGMNIISQFYWDFDLENKMVRISKFPFEISENPAFALNYYTHYQKGSPMVDVVINNDVKYSIEYDTGLASDYFILFKKPPHADSTAKIRHKKNDFFFSQYSSTDGSQTHRWLTDSLYVGENMVEDVMFMFVNSKEVRDTRSNVGICGNIPTLNRDFKRVYVNPFDKQILFYNKIEGGLFEIMKKNNDYIREEVSKYMTKDSVQHK